jgi:hypothetical protein
LSRQQIIERERRWALPAGLAALAAGVVSFVGLVVQSGVSTGDGLAEDLRSVDEHAGTLLLAAFLSAIGMLLLAAALLYLFRAAQARSDRVQGAFVAFIFIGPALFAAQFVVGALATQKLADDFLARQGELQEAPSLKDFEKTLEEQAQASAGSAQDDPKAIDEVTFYPDENGLDATLNDDTVYSLSYPADQRQDLQDAVDKAGIAADEDSDGKPGDDLAQQLDEDSSARQTAGILLLPALIGLITAVIYPCLHAMRAGLLTRFMGTLGIALGAALLFIGPIPLYLYLIALGLVFLDRVPGGRPPAWDAGEAIPWPRPGEEPPERSEPSSEAIEGEATELSGETGNPNAARRERAKRRKRKRRR